MQTTLEKLALKLIKSENSYGIRDPIKKIMYSRLCMGHHSLCITAEGVFLKM